MKRRGADFIKLQSVMTAEAVPRSDEAKTLGIPVAGHVPDAVRAADASNAGQRSFEHLIGIFEGSSRERRSLSRGEIAGEAPPELRLREVGRAHRPPREERDLAVSDARVGAGRKPDRRAGSRRDPLAKYAPATWKNGTWKQFTDVIVKVNVDDLATRRRFVDKEEEVVSAMHRAGVPFLAGTDTAAGVYVFPGFSLHEELELFVRAGFTPSEAMRRRRPRDEFLGMEDRLGSVETGKLGDLVVLDRNPLDDIRNTRESSR